MKKTVQKITEKLDANGKVIERITETTTEETPSYYPYEYVDWMYRPKITCYPSPTGGTLQSGYAQTTMTSTNKCETSTTTASSTT